MKNKEFTWTIKELALTTYDAALKSVLFDGVCGLFFEGEKLFKGKISSDKPFDDMGVGFSVNLARGISRDISQSEIAKDLLGENSIYIPRTTGALAGGLKSYFYKNEPFLKGAVKIFTYEYLEDLPKDANAKNNIFKSFATSLFIEEAGELIECLYNSYYNLNYKLENVAMTAIGTLAITCIIQGLYVPLKAIDSDVIDYLMGTDVSLLGSDYTHDL